MNNSKTFRATAEVLGILGAALWLNNVTICLAEPSTGRLAFSLHASPRANQICARGLLLVDLSLRNDGKKAVFIRAPGSVGSAKLRHVKFKVTLSSEQVSPVDLPRERALISTDSSFKLESRGIWTGSCAVNWSYPLVQSGLYEVRALMDLEINDTFETFSPKRFQVQSDPFFVKVIECSDKTEAAEIHRCRKLIAEKGRFDEDVRNAVLSLAFMGRLDALKEIVPIVRFRKAFVTGDCSSALRIGLFRFARQEEAMVFALKLTESKNDDLVIAGLRALRSYKAKESIPRVAELLDSPWKRVRDEACYTLTELSDFVPSPGVGTTEKRVREAKTWWNRQRKGQE